MKITIPGEPIAKARARVTKKGFAYDPQWELKKRVCKYLELSLQEFFGKDENRKEGFNLAHGRAFIVNWCFHMPIPKSFSLIKNNACEWGLVKHISKPDLTNMVKFYEDCGNNILWFDDSQIVRGSIQKNYSNNPRTEVEMIEIKLRRDEIFDIVTLFSPVEMYDMCHEASKFTNGVPDPVEIASFLSRISDLHAQKFSKISKKYPGYWKRIESNDSFN